MKNKITFTTIDEGVEALIKEYCDSEVCGEEMISFMLSNDSFDSSIPTQILHGAIQGFRVWDEEEGDDTDIYSDGESYTFPDGSIVPKGMRVGYGINEKIFIDENITAVEG